MNYVKITQFDTANGLGIGTVLWVCGCEHNCPQCHNPQTHDPQYGKVFNNETLDFLLSTLDSDRISRLTLSGGDPLYPSNRITTLIIVKAVKEKFPKKKIWLYTGYDYEEVESLQVIPFIDILVDGKFLIDKKDLSLFYKGSANQRVIDVQKTLSSGEISLFNFS